MTPGSDAVCEVLLDGHIVIYDPVDFSEEEAAAFREDFGFLNRNFFLATIHLEPTEV